jgi:FAD/FMN-containing dehydrogenase
VQQTLPVTKRYESWGRYPKARHAEAVSVFWRDELPQLDRFPRTVLPYGQGRSYGDCCQNDGGILLDTSGMRRFLAFDEQQGVLRCDAGVTFAEILERIVPRGWFLPVVPGTKWISVGGAIANDVHGKNFHRAGTFGCHVRQFQVLRSNGEQLLCSPAQNAGLYEATIAGLGLTGLILWAEIQLKRITSPMIRVEQIRFATLEEFFELSASSDKEFEYTVAWLDCTATRGRLGRGIFLRGNHADGKGALPANGRRARRLRIPFEAPNFLLNRWTIRAFNSAYFHASGRDGSERLVPYDTFFFPLDAIDDWNRLYGPRGFLQYQCAVRPEDAVNSIGRILRVVEHAGAAPALSVLKMFGSIRSPGMMSFPRAGTTLALDFAFEGEKTLRLLNELDKIVLAHDGAVYAAKDARMSADTFQAMYPQWQEFCRFIDPRFSSSLWRRVTGGGAEEKMEACADRRGNLSDRG